MATESTTLKQYYTMGFLSRTSIGMTISHEIEGRKKGRRSRPFFLPLIHRNTCHSERSEESHDASTNFLVDMIGINEYE